jgi:glutamate formiminotransferase/glutamate formiminotransferase/formiminotetrahydrofolate cyclodeaminase
MKRPILLGVPNVSEGRDGAAIAAIGGAFAPSGPQDRARVRLLNVHSDPDHHRSVYTLAAQPRALADALLAGAAAAVERIDVVSRAGDQDGQLGQHPHVGAVDVVPVVYVRDADRGAACAEALVVADRIGSELGVPVFLYGELTDDARVGEGGSRGPGERAGGRTRAELRRGGVAGLGERMASGVIAPDFGPRHINPTAGATLVAARPPLVAFNVQLAEGASLDDARAIAARVREGGEAGLPGVRAIAVVLKGEVMQVSMNVERPLEVSLAEVVAAVSAQMPVASGELVGLAPQAALEGFPETVPLHGFDPARQVIEKALGSLDGPDQEKDEAQGERGGSG